MTRKGQKHKKYTAEFKELVLKEYFSGEKGPKSLEAKYDVPSKTVEMWVWKTKHRNIDVKVNHRPGRSGSSAINNN